MYVKWTFWGNEVSVITTSYREKFYSGRNLIGESKDVMQYNLAGIDSPCEWLTKLAAVPQENARQIRQIIMDASMFPSDNFDEKAITALRVAHLLRLIDKHYFGGSFMKRAILKKHVVRAEIVVQKSKEFAWLERKRFKDNNRWKLRITVNRHNWARKSFANYDFFGKRPRSKLEALTLTLEHEFAHAIVQLFCPPKLEHCGIFRKITRNVFGHNSDRWFITEPHG